DGGGGNDAFISGPGNDVMNGGSGNDTYIYKAGDGSDTINEGGGNNKLVLGAGLTPADVTFNVSGWDLLISDGSAGDQIRIAWHYLGYQVQTLVYGDGTSISLTGSVPIVAGPGNVVVNGTSGNDILIAGTGNDTLNGGGGNDTFISGPGNDVMNGGSGNDTFIYTAGDGQATINEFGGNNLLQFGQGISDEQLWFAQQGNNLVVSLIGTSKQITVQNWYSGSSNQIQTFT